MNKEKRGKKIITSKRLYIWIFILTVIVFITACFTYYIWSELSSKTGSTKTRPNDMHLTAIVLIAGFLAAFSAISIYSIFNANVDEEKEKINNLIKETEGIRDQINELLNQVKVDAIKKLEDFTIQLEENVNITIILNNLTSPYSEDRKKREAIRHFSNLSLVREDIKKILLNYYNSFKSKKVERSKKYFKELKALLVSWNMIED